MCLASRTGSSSTLAKSGIQVPSTWLGNATASTIAPFSDKLMMYNTGLLSTFGLGGTAVGAAFSLRSDLSVKMAFLIKDTFTITNLFTYENGGKKLCPQLRKQKIKKSC
jgi:hypothetical protein